MRCNDIDEFFCSDLESAGLMALCLKKVGGLNKMKILEAFWVWTEPHSKRLRVGIDVEMGVLDGKIDLRQRVEIVYVVTNRQCLECIREASDHSWGAVIQLRQRVSSAQALARGLTHIENEIWKASLHNLMLGVETVKNGLDMFFKHKNQAEKVVNFLVTRVPARVKISKKMVSADRKSNTQKYEHAYLVDVAPLAKHDLVLLPRDSGRGCDLMVVSKVSSSLHFVSPLTLRRTDMAAARYFGSPFGALLSPTQLISFVVLDVQLVPAPAAAAESVRGPRRQKTTRSSKRDKGRGGTEEAQAADASDCWGGSGGARAKEEGGLLAEVEVARESDLGANDTTYRVMTHLGHLLSAGDIVMGFDLSHSTLSDLDSDGTRAGLRSGVLGQHQQAGLSQDVILIKKVFTEAGRGRGGKSAPEEEEEEEEEEAVVGTLSLYSFGGGPDDAADNASATASRHEDESQREGVVDEVACIEEEVVEEEEEEEGGKSAVEAIITGSSSIKQQAS
jgi:nonsense-mediated mRNA decay protein 3